MKVPQLASFLLFATIGLLVVSCGPPQAATAPLGDPLISNRAQPVAETNEEPAPLTATEKRRDDDKAAVGAALVALERMASAAASAQGNCDAMVGAVTDSIFAEIELWALLQEISADPKREVALTSAEEPLGEGMRRFAEALGECAFDRRIQQSLEAMAFASSL